MKAEMELQRRLLAAGHGYRSMQAETLAAFQAEIGLEITGEADEETMARLESEMGKGVPAKKAERERAMKCHALAVEAQQALGQNDTTAMKIDGDVGPKTKGAVRAFKVARGLPDTDDICEATLMLLNAEAMRDGPVGTVPIIVRGNDGSLSLVVPAL